MQVILLERVAKLGQMGDVVDVKPGFARNYLLPQGKALSASERNIADFEARKAQLEAQNLETRKEAQALADRLDGQQFIVIRQASDGGNLYGSVSTRDVADVATAEGFTIDRKQAIIRTPIKTLGLHEVEIHLHPEVMAINQLIRKKGIKYASADFRFLGSVTPVNPVLMAWHKSPVRNIDDVKKRVTIHSCSGTGSQTFIMPSMLNAFVGTKFKLVCGYKGSAAQTLALERGEVEVQSSAIISWNARHADWLRDKKIFPLVQVGLVRDKTIPDIPLMSELVTDPNAKAALEFISSGSPIGRSFIVHKDVPTDRFAVLEKAFWDTVNDPQFLSEAKERNANIEPAKGEVLDAIVAKTLQTPPGIVRLAAEAIQAGRKMQVKCTKNCVIPKKKK